MINGIDLDGLRELIDACTIDPANAQTNWRVTTRWMGGTVTETHVSDYDFAGRTVEKDFTIRTDANWAAPTRCPTRKKRSWPR